MQGFLHCGRYFIHMTFVEISPIITKLSVNSLKSWKYAGKIRKVGSYEEGINKFLIFGMDNDIIGEQ